MKKSVKCDHIIRKKDIPMGLLLEYCQKNKQFLAGTTCEQCTDYIGNLPNVGLRTPVEGSCEAQNYIHCGKVHDLQASNKRYRERLEITNRTLEAMIDHYHWTEATGIVMAIRALIKHNNTALKEEDGKCKA